MDTQTFELSWLDQERQRNERIRMGGNYIVLNSEPSETYVVHDADDVDNEEDILLEESSTGLQIAAAENLIQLANDTSVLTHIINNDGDGSHTVFVASDGIKVDCSSLINVKALVDNAHVLQYSEGNDEYDQQTDEITEQVTEEVITDDWVQHQGEERVEISADQVIGCNSQTVVEAEVPLRSNEYSALRPYPCDFCSRRFRKESNLEAHMIAHQSIPLSPCKLCGSRFTRRSELMSHLETHAGRPRPDVIIAETNGYGYVSSPRHRQRHNGQQESYMNDHYYDNNLQGVIANKNHRQSEHTNNMPRGRISRLKPKIIASLQPTEVDYFDSQLYQTSSSGSNAVEGSISQRIAASANNELKFPILCDSKPFVCQQCGLAFGRQKAYEAHIKNHRNESPLECDHCNETFWDKPSLQEHKKMHVFDDSNSEYAPEEADDTQSESETDKQQLYGEFFCSECGMAFHRKDLLTRHLKNHNRLMQNPNSALDSSNSSKHQHCCNTCGETFPEALDLLAHAEIHARYAPFKCVLCGESFFEEHTIKKHLQTLHANKMTENSCILCGKQCRDRKALMKHAWDHSREKSHSCSKCGKNFHNKARLKRHMASHRDKTVKCEVCHEEFPDGRSLSNHRHSHSTTSSGKLFPCNECGKTFGSRSSQQIHVRIHTGEKPYGCRFCWKAFADGGTLRKHERIHTGEKPYACSVCPRAFNQRVVLREHIRSHHSGLDPNRNSYFCMVCGDEMPTSNELISHLIGHSDMNTAMQRQPIAGPRKYKRRRKLKPHEIERLRKEHKHNRNDSNTNSQETSDIDLSDIDVDQIDDLLEAADTEQKAMQNTIKPARSNRKGHTKSNQGNALNKVKNLDKESPVDDTSNANSSKLYDGILGYDGLQKFSTRKPRADSFKLLTNVESALERIETLVVSERRNCDNKSGMDTIEPSFHNGSIIIIDDDSDKTAQRTQQVQIKRNNASVAAANELSSKAKKKGDKTQRNASQRPRMIHTEKYVGDGSNSGRGKMSRSVVKRTETSSLSLLPKGTRASLRNSAMTIVDEHEIMSPATQPPNQISSSPIHPLRSDFDSNFKQQQLQKQRQKQQVYQPLDDQHEAILLCRSQLQQQHQQRRRYLTSQSSQTSRSSDLYDAQLLLEATSFRKDSFSDLEDILRSPSKTEASSKTTSNRNRLTSECSTQYIAEHCIDEAHLIKIEPTSPDLHEIFSSCSNTNLSSNKQTTSSHDQQNQSGQKNYSSMRSSRPIRRNRRYLDFSDNGDYATQGNSAIHHNTSPNINRQQIKRKALNHSADSSTANGHNMSSSAASNGPKGLNLEISSVSSNGRLVNKLHAITKQNHADSRSSMGRISFDHHNAIELTPNFDSFSSIVNAAVAAATASSMGNSTSNVSSSAVRNEALGLSTKPAETKRKYFECEMCSAVFADRAQLLDHVPIHI